MNLCSLLCRPFVGNLADKISKYKLSYIGGICMLAACLVYSFTSYREQIIAEQKEQLLTIAKAVSNSISVYTEFYFEDLEDLESYEEYQRAGAAYLRMGSKAPLQRFLRNRMETRKEDVADLLVTLNQREWDDEGVLARAEVSRNYDSVYDFAGNTPGSRINILHDENEQYYLGLSIPAIEDQCRLWIILNIEAMYQKVGSYIRVGENGYVMIKDSTGRILLHPV